MSGNEQLSPLEVGVDKSQFEPKIEKKTNPLIWSKGRSFRQVLSVDQPQFKASSTPSWVFATFLLSKLMTLYVKTKVLW